VCSKFDTLHIFDLGSDDMPQSITLEMLLPVAIKRLPWMRRLSVISQRLSRQLTVFSYESYNLWSFIESHPAITPCCPIRQR